MKSLVRMLRGSAYALITTLLACGGSSSDKESALFDDVQGLFAASCAGASCHTGYTTAPAASLDLGKGAECSSLVGVPAVEAPSLERVVPGSAKTSYLLCKLLRTCADRPQGASIMPLGLAALGTEDLDLVTSWIDSGAPGCAGPDGAAPAFAGATSATALPSAIRVEWTAAMDDTTAAADVVYLVYEASASKGQDFTTPTAMTGPGETSIVMGGLPVSTKRFYVVRARDSAGNIDKNTVEVSATTPATGDETPPTFVGATSATPVGSSTLDVAWPAASDDVSPARSITYRVYVATTSSGQNFGSPSATAGPGVLTVLVAGLTPMTTYHIVVRAVDQAGNEDQNLTEITGTTGAAVSFSGQIQLIFGTRCSSLSCHGGQRPAEGLDLRAGSAYADLVDVPASQCSGRLRVAPGQPEASYLMNKLLGVDLCLGTAMPKGSSLPAGDIQIVADWIREGARNN